MTNVFIDSEMSDDPWISSHLELRDEAGEVLATSVQYVPVAEPTLVGTVSDGHEVRVITVDEVCYFRAESKYTLVITAEGADGSVRWAESTARQLTCHYAPVDVAGELSSLMQAQSCAWILTSGRR